MAAYGYDWHQTTVGRAEAAQRPLRLNEAVALAALFGVSLEILLTRTGTTINPWALKQRINDARKRVEMAEKDYRAVHERWDAATAELVPLGQENVRAREVMEAAQGELDSLVRVLGQIEGAEPPEPPS